MQQECAFDFRTGAVVASAYYRVVGARLVDEIAAVVDQVRVADVILAIFDVILLAFVGGKAAAAAIGHRCLGFHLVIYRPVKPWLPPRFIDFDARRGGFLFQS